MKHFTRNDLDELQRRKRANLINSITGYKPANLIGTIDENGRTNLAIFSSCVHLGANPPLIGFIMRPIGDVTRHTYSNIKSNGRPEAWNWAFRFAQMRITILQNGE